ncbi:venom carboxylesterase-6-like [Leptidea sinapis]|uniref:venom carboxylesterase-6-like n=1 Tax=Leptidea sinapis TaxID=189913 RepID=UPI0021455085|nr:venom carboxylesterase-6-like [Leptidea sinapis]
MRRIILLFCFAAYAFAQELSVNTTHGMVVGKRATDGDYYTFYGIRYGGSTSGANRFKAPTPAPTYTGVYQADDSSVFCAQPTARGLVGVEDCLVLNVFTRNASISRPVVVWLESEEYTTSRQELFTFKKLIDEELVVVSIHYRLSIFGFLCLGVPAAPGNAGLKDIIQGLKWINVNIAGFGGDPRNVVLLGHGSGAAIAELISLSPLGHDLVHKVIAISGSALAPWAVAYEPVQYAERFSEKLSYSGKSKENLAKSIANTDLNVLVPSLKDFTFFNNTPLFAPCIESSDISEDERVLPDAPINLLRSGNYSQIPYISVFVDMEGTLRAEQAAFNNWIDTMQANFSDFLPVDLNLESDQNKSAVVQSIREFYFAQQPVNMEGFLNFEGDTLVVVSMIRGVTERAKTSTAPVRLLEFAYRGTHNSDWPYTQIRLDGVKHGGLLNYLFDFDLRPADVAVQTAILRRFSEFAKNGNPNPTNYVNSGITWNPYTDSSPLSLRISGGDVITVGKSFQEEERLNIHQQRMNFWNKLYSQYYHPPQSASSAVKILSVSLTVVFCLLFVKLL